MAQETSFVPSAWRFTVHLVMPVLMCAGVWQGGWAIALVPFFAIILISIMDALIGQDPKNPDLAAEHDLSVHKLLVLSWAPIQILLIFGMIFYVPQAVHLSTIQEVLCFLSLGVITGGIGIVFAHELMHKPSRIERHAGDVLMASVLYGHFRSEHLLVHHRYVGTPKDAVSARFNEGFYIFFPRVLVNSFKSSFRAEQKMLERKGLSPFHRSNPFWKYAILQIIALTAAWILAGWWGIVLLAIQGFVAVTLLELINYIEHYALTRRHIGDGKYEHAKPHHSWDCDYLISNGLLVNLQRHSGHHYKPDLRYPLLPTYSAQEAPQLPFGYPIMILLALFPPAYKALMNPKVLAWREQFYPDIEDWTPYNLGTNPVQN